MKRKNKSDRFWSDRRLNILLSLIIAVFLWIYITMVLVPSTTDTLSGVPVNFTYDSSKYTSLGLDIVNEPAYKVTLNLSGNGSVLGAVEASDFVVYPDYSAVKGAGAQTLSLKVRILNSDLEGSVTATIEKDQRTVDVVFDTVEEKSFPVSIEVGTLSIADGYALNRITSAPAEVTLRGPSSEISQVSKVVAHLSMEGELSESKLAQVSLELQDAAGQPLDLKYTTLDNELVDVTVSVYRVAELPLEVNFINVPSYFDVESLKYELSQKTLRVSGPEKVISNLTSLSVGSFDLSTFSLEKDYQMQVALPNGIVSQENISSVTLSFDTTGMGQKSFHVNQIDIINVPANYQVEPSAKRLNNVVLVGPEEELEALSPGNIVAVINAEDIQVAVGQQNVPVQIQIPSNPHIFAIGTYTVQCEITSR